MNYLRIIVPIAATLAISVSGCYATVHTPTPAAGVSVGSEYDFEPQYYGDYVVYYDDGGSPYYYVNGSVRYIPRSDSRFNVYVNTYRRHGVEYRRWHNRVRNAHIERREHWERERSMHRHRR